MSAAEGSLRRRAGSSPCGPQPPARARPTWTTGPPRRRESPTSGAEKSHLGGVGEWCMGTLETPGARPGRPATTPKTTPLTTRVLTRLTGHRSATSARGGQLRRSASSASTSGSTSRSRRRWRGVTSTTSRVPASRSRTSAPSTIPTGGSSSSSSARRSPASSPRRSSCARTTPSSTSRLDRHTAESEVRRELEEFNARVMKARYTPVDGPPLVTMPRDVDAEVDAWRERRLARRRQAAARQATTAPVAPAPRRRRRWFGRRGD